MGSANEVNVHSRKKINKIHFYLWSKSSENKYKNKTKSFTSSSAESKGPYLQFTEVCLNALLYSIESLE